jgi:50S ribosomal protein L16 3-hydroxylase
MLEGFSDFLISRAGESRYEDPAPTLPRDLNEIEAGSLTNSFARLKQQVDDVSLFQQWFGCHVTQPKYPELIVPLSGEQAEFAQHALEDAESLSHHPSSRFAFLEDSESLFLFADGQAAKFPLTLKEPLARLCEATPLSGESLDNFLAEPRLNELLLRLVKQGSLQID